MRILYFALTSLLLFSCKDKTTTEKTTINEEQINKEQIDQIKSGTYRIEGEFNKFEDSTLIGLFINNDVVDSTYIINGKFLFDGKFEEPLNARVLVKQTAFFADFWIENGTVNLTNTGEDRLETQIQGGKIQTEENVLTERIVPVSKRRDSIYQILSNPNVEPQIKTKSNNYLKVIRQEEKQVCLDFLKDYPNSIASMRLLNIFKSVWDKELVQKTFDQADSAAKASKYGKILEGFLKISANPEIDDQYIDFTQNDVDGNAVTFSKVKKKYTLLNFWASWCIPCRELNPQLLEVYNEYKDKGFEIVAVSVDQDKRLWKDAIKEDQINWIHLSNLQAWENPAAYKYGVQNVPENFLIDPDGKIIKTKIMPSKIREVLSKALN